MHLEVSLHPSHICKLLLEGHDLLHLLVSAGVIFTGSLDLFCLVIFDDGLRFLFELLGRSVQLLLDHGSQIFLSNIIILFRLEELGPERVRLSNFDLIHGSPDLLVSSRLGHLLHVLSVVSLLVASDFYNLIHALLRHVISSVDAHIVHELIEVIHNLVFEVLEVLQLGVNRIKTTPFWLGKQRLTRGPHQLLLFRLLGKEVVRFGLALLMNCGRLILLLSVLLSRHLWLHRLIWMLFRCF